MPQSPSSPKATATTAATRGRAAPAAGQPDGRPGEEGGGLPADIAALSFEQAMAELETIVRTLEQGTVTLDQAVGAYERGVALRRHCEARLQDARLTVERITTGPDGAVRSDPFESS